MTREEVDYIIQNRKHPVSFFRWWRYASLLFPSFPLVVGISIFLSEGVKKPFVFVWPPIIIIGLYLVKLMVQHIERDRKFHSIYTNVANQKVVAECMAALGWKVKKEESIMVLGETKVSLSSWGEVITVIIINDELLFNSRPVESPISSGRDVRNFWQFYEQIELKEKQLQLTEQLQKHD